MRILVHNKRWYTGREELRSGLLSVWLVVLGLGFGVNAVKASDIPAASPFSSNNQENAKAVEYQIKAAFIYNFMKFTEWPDSKNREGEKALPNTPMIVGIIGNDSFKEAFKPLLDKTIKDRPLQVIQIPGIKGYVKRNPDRSRAVQQFLKEQQDQIQICHVLFMDQSEEEYAPELLEAVQNTGVLTIGDSHEFLQNGGVIGFVREDNKIRFQVHITNAEKQQLKLSAQLLKLAHKVIHEPKDK